MASVSNSVMEILLCHKVPWESLTYLLKVFRCLYRPCMWYTFSLSSNGTLRDTLILVEDICRHRSWYQFNGSIPELWLVSKVSNSSVMMLLKSCMYYVEFLPALSIPADTYVSGIWNVPVLSSCIVIQNWCTNGSVWGNVLGLANTYFCVLLCLYYCSFWCTRTYKYRCSLICICLKAPTIWRGAIVSHY